MIPSKSGIRTDPESQDDLINKIYGNIHEAERVKRLLRKAEEESSQKKIRPLRKVRPLYNKWVFFKIMYRYGIHWSKPIYPFRLLRNILLSKAYALLKIDKHVLRGCEFALTFKCNFHCSHCLCARIDESGERRELVPDDYRQIVAQAMKLGATTFGMEGGEPFVRKEWVEIIEACRPKYNHIIITTNGYLFNELIAKKCSELGVDTVNVSLDSGIPELHDLFRRKPGSHKRVMNVIRLCKKYEIKVVINTVLHKKNLYTEGFLKILELSEKEKVLVHVLFAKAIGSFKDNDSMLDEEDFKAYERLSEHYPYAYVHHEIKRSRTISNYGHAGCHGTKEMLNFTPYGDVMNCANMHIYFGNVQDESLAEIRKRALKTTPFNKYRPCYLTMDNDFMNVYYDLVDKKPHVDMDEFNNALKDYENKHNRRVYPDFKAT